MKINKRFLADWGSLILLVAFILICFLGYDGKSQTPIAAYYFSGNLRDSVGAYHLTTNPPAQYINGNTGKCLNVLPTSKVINSPNIALGQTFSVEFAFKFNEYSGVQFINHNSRTFYFKIEQDNFTFITNSQDTAKDHNMSVDFRGVDRRCLGYYLEGWHLIAFSYNAGSGIKKVYADGVLIKQDTAKPTVIKYPNPVRGLSISSSSVQSRINGQLDEIAIYNKIISDSAVAEHWSNFQQGKHFNFGRPTATILTPALNAPPDTLDFPPGYAHGSYELTQLEYLQRVPAPRIAENTTIPRLFFGWFNARDFADNNPRTNVEINTLYYTKFHGAITAPTIGVNYNNYRLPLSYEGAIVALLNANPTWEAHSTMFWKYAKPSLIGHVGDKPNILSTDLSKQHYLYNGSNQFLTVQGTVTTSKTQKRIAPYAPTDSFTVDGLAVRASLDSLLSKIDLSQRPFKLWENQEMYPHHKQSTLLKCPAAVAEKNALGIVEWRKYMGYSFARVAGAYVNAIKTHPKIEQYNIPIRNYYTTGDTIFGGLGWEYTRNMTTPVEGCRHANPGLYTVVPASALDHIGSFEGLRRCLDKIGMQMQYGDSFFIPNVALGWSHIDEKNIRSTQGLGLFKMYIGAGAITLNPSNYNGDDRDTIVEKYAPPASYVNQAVIPSYAVETTTNCEWYYRNSIIQEGDIPYNPAKPTGPKSFLFNTHDPRVPCIVRKVWLQNKYLIYTTIQPLSNDKGNAPLSKNVYIHINGARVDFETRRQGSVYLYDADAKTLLQYDYWHQSGDPIYWDNSLPTTRLIQL